MIDALGIPDRGRALPLRRRPDVEIIASPHDDARHELVKDPVALRYFELPEEEAFLWRQFDGTASREEIRTRFERRFAPRRLDAEQLDRFVAQLYRQGLLVTDRAGQGAVLLERAREQRVQRFRSRLMNPLAITLPGVDPRPVLDRLLPLVGWMFSPASLVGALLLVVAAGATAVLHATKLFNEVAAYAGSLTLDGLAATAVVLAALKIVHELAHAVACRRFGGECREIGVLLLVGVPALYCDVTGIWMVRERWKRVVVGAAGMLAEIVVASVALLLWNGSEPGLFHTICLQVAVVGSAATLVFNGNPLLRYDGYFILSDLVRITNLGEQADTALRDRVTHWFLGDSTLEDERRFSARRRPWLAWYAAASLAYKLALTIGILWFLQTAAEPVGLGPMVSMLSIMVLATTVGMPTIQGAKHVQERQRVGQIDRRRFLFRTGGCLVAAAAILLWPWSYRVAAPAIVRWDGATMVNVTTPGRLIEAVAEGTFVRGGEQVAKLRNLEIEREIIRLEGEREEKLRAVKSLDLRSGSDEAAGKELPTAQKALEAIENRLKLRRDEAERLVLAAPNDGFVLSVPASEAVRNRPEVDEGADAVGDAFGSPLEPRLRGKFLEAGTALCVVGDPNRVEAVLVVDEREIEFVRENDRVRLQFDVTGAAILEGRVDRIAERTLKDAPEELVVAGRLPAEVDGLGKRRSSTPSFQVRVVFDAGTPRLPLDAIGQAKIETKPQNLLERGLRWLSGTFRLQPRQP